MIKDFSTIEGRFLKNASWDEAISWAKKINKQKYAGYNDWKVPSISEYRSINKNSNDRKVYFFYLRIKELIVFGVEMKFRQKLKVI